MPLGRAGSIPAQRTKKPPKAVFFIPYKRSRNQSGAPTLLKRSDVLLVFLFNSAEFKGQIQGAE